jgi:hypothetical protein
MNKYKYVSEDTTKYMYLHDCFAKRFYCLNNNWYMELPYILLNAEHPLNTYNKIYFTDDCNVIFENPILIDYSVQTYNDKFSFTISDNINLNNLQLYSYYENDKISNEYKYAELGFMTEENDFIVIEFLYKKSIIKWNIFDAESWYEDNYYKKIRTDYQKKYSKIIKMLSENNSKEIQQKGIELAKEINSIENFFQPIFEGESEMLWKNCAKVISQRTDDELKKWILVCLFWLQDMNYNGAEIISERLKAFSDKDKLLHEKQKAVKIAKIIKDTEWLKNLEAIQ